jgi:hypothetical protein
MPKFELTLPPEIQAGIQAQLDALPGIRAGVAHLTGLGVDTSDHINKLDSLEAHLRAILKTFGKQT